MPAPSSRDAAAPAVIEGLPSVSVVAPTYMRRAALPTFVEPLLREPGLTELVLAVDGSGDGSVEWARDRRESDERIVVLDLPNRGAGATRQAGVEAATSDIVLLMDDDVIASPGLVAGHARHHIDLDLKLVLGYMPNDWHTLPHGRRGIAWVYRDAYERHCRRWLADPGVVLHGLWGGNLSMPREHLLRVGIEKLAVKRGQDDREFGLRCLKAGATGVDIVELHQLPHPRIDFLLGSSTDPAIVERVRGMAAHADGPVMVILDGDHSRDHVAAELELYAPLVTPGSLLLSQDGVIDEMWMFRDTRPGPLPANRAFLERHPEFEHDRERNERFLLSHHPVGWLRRRA